MTNEQAALIAAASHYASDSTCGAEFEHLMTDQTMRMAAVYARWLDEWTRNKAVAIKNAWGGK